MGFGGDLCYTHPMQEERLGKIRGILFDLDGTLLQIEMKTFIPAYVGALAACFADVTERRKFSDTVLATTFALLQPRESGPTNETLFLMALERQLGIAPPLFAERLRRFSGDGLHDLAPHVRPLPMARRILQRCFDRGLKVALATNPVFPRLVTEARLRWGNLHDFPFAHVSSFENSRHCKPDPGYFRDLLADLDLAPEECLMVGNDTEHDLAAARAGILTFLVDTWLVDRLDGAFAADFRGGHPDLFRFAGRLGGA